MNYIYDILLNLNSKIYEVYDWNKNDRILHVRKIPFIKIPTNSLFKILNYKIKFNDDLMLKIYKKTEIFTKNIAIFDYLMLLTDGIEVIAVKLNNGIITGFSKLLYDEEREVLEYSKNMSFRTIECNILSKFNYNYFETRNESYIKKYILQEIQKMVNNDYNKLKYIYLEWFNKVLEDDSFNNLNIEKEDKWEDVYLHIYRFLKQNSLKS